MKFNLNDIVYWIHKSNLHVECEACNGTGSVTLSDNITYPCPACDGSGTKAVSNRSIKTGVVGAVSKVEISSEFLVTKLRDSEDVSVINKRESPSTFSEQLHDVYYVYDSGSKSFHIKDGRYDFKQSDFYTLKESDLFETEESAQAALDYTNSLHDILIF